MARTRKYTVEYFPHHCKNGKVVTILENRWGNEGYAFFYRLLQLLGDSEGHFIDCRNQDDWEYLVARMRVSEEIAEAILAKLSDLRVIDKELWDLRVIWDQDFVDDLTEVYRKRRTDPPNKPNIRRENASESEFSTRESAEKGILSPEMRQSKVKESKEYTPPVSPPINRDEKEPGNPKKFTDEFISFWTAYPKKVGKDKAWEAWRRKKSRPPISDLVATVEKQKTSNEWMDQGGKFIPNPATWINQGRWQDQLSYGGNNGHGSTGGPKGFGKHASPGPEIDPEVIDTSKRLERGYRNARDAPEGET